MVEDATRQLQQSLSSAVTRLRMIVSSNQEATANQITAARTLLEYSAQHGICTFCYGTLAGGFLDERYMGKVYEAPETRSQVKYMQIIEDSLGWDGMQKLLVLLRDIAGKYGVSVANVAVQYILRQKSVGAVMVGTRNSKHVESNVRTLQFDLSDEDMAAIRAFLDQYPTPEGECYELERTSPRYQSIILTDLNK